MPKNLKNIFSVLWMSVILTVVIFPIVTSYTSQQRDITPDFCRTGTCYDVPTSSNEVGWPFVYKNSSCCGIGGEMSSLDFPVLIDDVVIMFLMISIPVFLISYIIKFLATKKYAKTKKTK